MFWHWFQTCPWFFSPEHHVFSLIISNILSNIDELMVGFCNSWIFSFFLSWKRQSYKLQHMVKSIRKNRDVLEKTSRHFSHLCKWQKSADLFLPFFFFLHSFFFFYTVTHYKIRQKIITFKCSPFPPLQKRLFFVDLSLFCKVKQVGTTVREVRPPKTRFHSSRLLF